MSKYKAANVFQSMKFALRGLALAMKSQRNFRIEFFIAIFVLLLAIYLKLSHIKIAIIVLTSGFMMFAELINTVVEFIIDAYFGNKYSILAKMAKDTSAGAVLLCAGTTVMIGIVLFLPELIDRYRHHFMY